MRCRFERVEDACAVYALSNILCGLLLSADALGLRYRSVNGGGGCLKGLVVLKRVVYLVVCGFDLFC